MTSTWHVGKPAAKTYSAEDRGDTAWDKVGVHLLAEQVPARLVDRLNLPITEAADVDYFPVTGTFWNGEDGAAKCVEAAEMMVNARYPGLDALFAGAVSVEHSSAEKAGRLDGMPAGSWCMRTGYVEGAWDEAPPTGEATEDEWYEAMVAWLSACDRTSTAALRSHSASYLRRFDTYDITKHKGYPSFCGGGRVSSVNAHARLARALRTREATLWEIIAYHDTLSKHPICAVQFNRRQPGRKWVDYWKYDPAHDGPVRMRATQNVLPKIRDVWAYPNFLALVTRRATGRLFARLKASPLHSVTADAVGATVKGAHAAKIGQAWASYDYSGFDKAICAAANRAGLRVLLEHADADERDVIEAILEHSATMPILSSSHKPGSPAYLYHRNRCMISGVPWTTAVDNIVNGAAHLLVHSRALGGSVRYWADQVGIAWMAILAGDDVIKRPPLGLSEETAFKHFAAIGLEVTKSEGVNFLARQYDVRTGASIPCVSSFCRNTLFKEQKARTDEPLLWKMGIYASKEALTSTAYGPGHPYAHYYDDVIKKAAPADVALALKWDKGDAVTAARDLMNKAMNTTGVDALLALDAATGALGGAADEDPLAVDDKAWSVAAARIRRRRTRVISESMTESMDEFPTWQSAMAFAVSVANEVPF